MKVDFLIKQIKITNGDKMKQNIILGIVLILGIFVIGCTGIQSDDTANRDTNDMTDLDYTCPEDNKYFACRSPDDPRPTCGAFEEDHLEWITANCPGVEILE